jgi:ATP-dependent protease HslVU (ClpYQ) peptidase subunit
LTVLAWDGRFLVADRQATFGGTAIPATKVFRHNDVLIGVVGDAQEVMAFLEWYKSKDLPKPTLKAEFSSYVVSDKKLYKYESMLYPFLMDTPFWAAGCGADYAMGAMAAGKTAQEAVEIACKLDINCGLGIDVLDSEELK